MYVQFMSSFDHSVMHWLNSRLNHEFWDTTTGCKCMLTPPPPPPDKSAPPTHEQSTHHISLIKQASMLCKVTHCAGRISANTRPHQLRWGDREMGTAISCTECSQVAGLIQKSVETPIFESTVSSCSCSSCSCLSFEDLV